MSSWHCGSQAFVARTFYWFGHPCSISCFLLVKGQSVDLDKLVLTISSPIFVNRDGHEAVMSVVGLQMKYTKFSDLFLNGSQLCSEDTDVCRPCAKEVISTKIIWNLMFLRRRIYRVLFLEGKYSLGVNIFCSTWLAKLIWILTFSML